MQLLSTIMQQKTSLISTMKQLLHHHQLINKQPTAMHPPLTEPNMEASGSCLPTDQEQLTSTPIPAFELPEMYNASKLRVNDVIEFTKPNTETMKVKLVSRAGKVGKSGNNKYSQEWNVVTPEGFVTSVDLKNDVTSWTYIGNDYIAKRSDQELLSNEIYQTEIENEVEEAKAAELDNWQKQEVYDEVQDKGQPCVSVRWVITPNLVDGKMSTKARLVAKGFKEVKDFRTDSPTCSRESLRLMTTYSLPTNGKYNLLT